MNLFMENPGLCHIGEKILTNLDFKTQLDCRLVQKSWRHIIDEKASKIDGNVLQTFFHQSVRMKMKRLRHLKFPVVDEKSYVFWLIFMFLLCCARNAKDYFNCRLVFIQEMD